MSRLLAISMLLAASACGTPSVPANADAGRDAHPDDVLDDGSFDAAICAAGPGEIYERRIEPLISQDRPSSCSKCHAAGVDLAAFVRGDPCSTMACLVERDLVDLQRPHSSKLLEFIDRGHLPGPNTGVTDAMVAEEYSGFLAWIEWSADCMESGCGDVSTACGDPPPTPLADADAGTDADTDAAVDMGPPPMTLANYPCDGPRQAAAFRDHVFPSHARCGHCHAEDGAIAGIAGAPTWISADQDLDGARQTITNLYALGAIDFDNPRKSRVLLKPLREDEGGIEHGGGGKYQDREDDLYKAFYAWILMQRQCLPALPDPGEYDEPKD